MPDTTEPTLFAPAALGPPPASAWMTDQDLTERLWSATLTLLDSLEFRFHDQLVFSDALLGGGEYVCELAELDEAFAPLIEAEATRLVVAAGGLNHAGLFSQKLPAVVAAIDRLPLDEQARVVHCAAELHVQANQAVMHPRIVAFHSRSTVRPALNISPPGACPTASTAQRASASPRR